MLDFAAAVSLEGVADNGVVLSEDVLRFGVAEALGEGGGAFHVEPEIAVIHSRTRTR